jgi:TfoX/Sxy family transcriptional regulator of competence genes
MAYDEKLAARMRNALMGKTGVTEKKMFGGVAFMQHQHMFAGVVIDEMMVRVGKVQYADSLSRKHVREMDFTGKPMAGYVFVAPEGLKTKQQLVFWLERGIAFADTLPPKLEK